MRRWLRKVSTAVALPLLATVTLHADARAADECKLVGDVSKMEGQLPPLAQRMVAIAGADTQLLQTDFTFKKVMQRIVQLGGVEPSRIPAQATTLVDSMLETYALDKVEVTNLDATGSSAQKRPYVLAPRKHSFDAAALLGGDMKPVALFNRIDLRDRAKDPGNEDFDKKDFGNKDCGEVRLVFAAEHSTKHLFLIFESRMENLASANPDPVARVATCAALARFWRDLARPKGGSEPERTQWTVEQLRRLFFDGLTNDSGATIMRPVLDPVNIRAGQVRANTDIRANTEIDEIWELREWELASNELKFEMATVKLSPNPALFRDDDEDPLRAEFQAAFLNEYAGNMLEPDAKLLPFDQRTQINVAWFLASIKAQSAPKFDSIVSLSNVTYDPAQSFRIAIQGKLPSGYQYYQLANRVTALSCGGCHGSAGAGNTEIAPGVFWPATLTNPHGFVHVNRDGDLSPALLRFLLPARCESLLEFVNSQEETRLVSDVGVVRGDGGAGGPQPPTARRVRAPIRLPTPLSPSELAATLSERWESRMERELSGVHVPQGATAAERIQVMRQRTSAALGRVH